MFKELQLQRQKYFDYNMQARYMPNRPHFPQIMVERGGLTNF